MRHRGRLLRGHRTGYTLLEVLVALLMTTIILGAVYDLFVQLTLTSRSADMKNDVSATLAQIGTAIRADVELGDATTFSTANWSAVRGGVGTIGGVAADTLVVMYGVGPQLRASALPCRASTGGSCMRLQGGAAAAQSLSVNDLVVAGSPFTGARLYQVRHVRYFGADLVGEDGPSGRWSLADQPQGTVAIDTATTATYRNAAGAITGTVAGVCPYSYDVNGNSCTETRSTNTVPAYVAGDVQLPPQGASWATAPYAEIDVTDVTTLFGYPDFALYTPLSGAHGIPLVVVQKLGYGRYYVDFTRPKPTLVRQSGLTAAGALGSALPIAANVTQFQVDILHRGALALQRGTGVTTASLLFGAGSCAYTGSGSGAAFYPGAPGWSCSTSFGTEALVRARFTVAEDQALAARGLSVYSTEGAVTIATPGIAHGGVLPP